MTRKIIALSLALVTIGIITPFASVAYLIDSKEAESIFSVKSVSIQNILVRDNTCTAMETNDTCAEVIAVRNVGTANAYVATDIWIPTESIATDENNQPLYYSVDQTRSDDWDPPVEETKTVEGKEYKVFRFLHSEPVEPNQGTGLITFSLTNHQILNVTSGDLNEGTTECEETEPDCETTTTMTAGLQEAGIKIYSRAIQAQGFANAQEAFSNINY